jgi:DNA-binding winged helix-turn-helix (wHTH) protein
MTSVSGPVSRVTIGAAYRGGPIGRLGTGQLGTGQLGTGQLGTVPRPVAARHRPAPETRSRDGLLIDVALRAAYVDGAIVDLSATQFDLLTFLVRNAGQAHSRGELLRAVQRSGRETGRGRSVDVLVTRLRHKLGPEYRESVETLRGFGYRLHADLHIQPETPFPSAHPLPPSAGRDRWRLRWSDHARRLPPASEPRSA